MTCHLGYGLSHGKDTKMNVYHVSAAEKISQDNISDIGNINLSAGRGHSLICHHDDGRNVDIIFTTTASSQVNNLTVASATTMSGYETIDVQLLKFVVWGILGSCLAVLGFLGNTLSIVVLYRRQMRSSTSYYLISLAIYDNVILLGMTVYFCLPSIAPYTSFLENYQSLSSRTIIIGYPLSLAAHMGSIYTCVGFTIERYIAVCWPLRAAKICTKSRTARAIVFIFLWSLAYNIPRFFHYEINYTGENESTENSAINSLNMRNGSIHGIRCMEIHGLLNRTSQCPSYIIFNVTNTQRGQLVSNIIPSVSSPASRPDEPRHHNVQRKTIYRETEFGSGHTFKHIYLIYSQLLFMFLLPFLVLLVMNVRLIQAMRGSKSMQRSMSAFCRKEYNLTVMLISVIVVFLICQFPTIVDNILVAMMSEDKLQESYSYMCFWITCTFMVEINAASNFILYCFFGKKFRMVLLAMLGLKRRYYQVSYRSTVCRSRVHGTRTDGMELLVI